MYNAIVLVVKGGILGEALCWRKNDAWVLARLSCAISKRRVFKTCLSHISQHIQNHQDPDKESLKILWSSIRAMVVIR